MQSTVYTNARGESIMPLATFKELKAEAVMASLLPAKLHIPTKARKQMAQEAKEAQS